MVDIARINSPLVEEKRGNITLKITLLYEELFNDATFVPSEGFWREFFMLPCSTFTLSNILRSKSATDFLLLQDICRELFSNCISYMQIDKSLDIRVNACQTLVCALGQVLSRKYTNYSSDVITILAGFENVDYIFLELVNLLDLLLKSNEPINLRNAALHILCTIVACTYHSIIISYFVNHSLFLSLLHFVSHDAAEADAHAAITCLGILCNYQKFESSNPYEAEILNCSDEQAMLRVLHSTSEVCKGCVEDYVAVKNDLLESKLTSVLNYVGLGKMGSAPSPPRIQVPLSFDRLPCERASVLLSFYEFVLYNSTFHMLLCGTAVDHLLSFLSFASYLFTHQHRSLRASSYAYLSLLTLNNFISDPQVCQALCIREGEARICRQVPPILPISKDTRKVILVLFDVILCGISHNLRKKLDVRFYIVSIDILSRLIHHLSNTKTRIVYHWEEVWKALYNHQR